MPQWDLPPWGHPTSQGVLPLYVTYDDRLYPVGTAFTFGRTPTFVATAAHNIFEVGKYEERVRHLLSRELPSSIDLKHAGLGVMHTHRSPEGRFQLTLWPLETVDAAPPTDVVFGYPQFQSDLATADHRLSFELPTIGETVRSVGYTAFRFPDGGIPLQAVREDSFDWEHDYGHRLTVVEARVERIFTQRFSHGFLGGPCFVIDQEIGHAASGGPVFSQDGVVRGINSAGATKFFDKPSSLVSLFYPLMTHNLRFGVSMGPIRMNSSQPIISLIDRGIVSTDGSEMRVGIGQDEPSSKWIVRPVSPIDTAAYVHDDFAGFQAGTPASKETAITFRLRRRRDDDPPAGN